MKLVLTNKKNEFPVLDKTKFIISKEDLKKLNNLSPPLRITAAEQQSRRRMEEIASSARLLHFDSNGKVINKSDGSNTDFPTGLGLFKISSSDFTAIQSLHRVIVDALRQDSRLTPWAGVGEGDKRKRGYAFLPHSYGKFGKSALTAAGVEFHAAEKKGKQT